MDEHDMSGELDEIALMNGQFERYRSTNPPRTMESPCRSVWRWMVAMGAAMIFVTAIWRLTAVH